MNKTNKDILALTLWIVSIGLILAGTYVLYTEYGVNTPYHENIFPGRSTEAVELSPGGELAENLAHLFMYLLDLGVPIFAMWVTHHLLMSLREILSGHEG